MPIVLFDNVGRQKRRWSVKLPHISEDALRKEVRMLGGLLSSNIHITSLGDNPQSGTIAVSFINDRTIGYRTVGTWKVVAE